MLSILAKRDLDWVKGNRRISLTGVKVALGSGHGARATLGSSPSAYCTGPHVMAFLKSVSPEKSYKVDVRWDVLSLFSSFLDY